MPRGYRFIFAAIIGFMSLSAAQPHSDSSQPAQVPDKKLADSLENIAHSIAKTGENPAYTATCRRNEDNRNSDLCAQWKAADASESAAHAAWWIGGFGAIIGALTLLAAAAAAKFARDAALHTKAGADEARRAADAAERGLRHSEEITRAELRAYFAAEKEVFRLDGSNVFVTVHLRNVGQTPANEVTITRQFIGHFGRRKEKIFHVTPSTNLTGTVGPKVPIESYNGIYLRPGQLRALKAGIGQIELRLALTFVDMFSERWKYEQHLLVTSSTLTTGVITTTTCRAELNQDHGRRSRAKKPRGKAQAKSTGRKKS